LQDTNVAAQLLYSSPGAWSSWRRGVDYYDEGELIWLEADVTLRRLTGSKKSLDDFARLFHGPAGMGATTSGVVVGPPALKPYTFDDVVNAMNQVAPYDWRKFFTERLTSLDAGAPLGGIEQGGWHLVFDDTPGEMGDAAEGSRRQLDAVFSVGLSLNDSGTVQDVVTGSPAYQAGFGPGMKLMAVNGRRFSMSGFNEALAAAARPGAGPIEFIVENGEYYRVFRVDYHDGKRYPHLVRDAGRPDVLAEIIKQHAPAVAVPVQRIEIVR
jgi:predicted metalloprotease with PDZ domain